MLEATYAFGPRVETAQPARADGLRWPLVLAVAAFFFGVYYTLEHDPRGLAGTQSTETEVKDVEDEYIDGIEDGNANRKMAIVAYGLVGLVALARARQTPWNVQAVGAALLLGLVGWGVASVLWSSDSSLTTRRVVSGLITLGGCLGFARLLKPDELLAVVLTTFTVFVATSFVIDVGAGGRPWEADHRFGGTLHPNIQSAYCAMICLAAFCFPSELATRWVARGLFGFGLVLLIQTQSRTSVLALAVALLGAFLVRLGPNSRRWALLGMAFLLAGALLVIGGLSDGAKKELVATALMGRTEQSSSLTGRVPLWEELSGYVAQRPLQGYGYESFWTPDHIAEVMKSQKWVVQSAHNAYIELVLQVGWIGLLLALGVVLAGLVLMQRAFARTGSAGYAFAYGMMAFALTNSLLESHFAKLKYPTVIAIITLLSVVAFFPVEPAPEDNDESRRRPHWRRDHRSAPRPHVVLGGGRRRA